jgi:hypothetical protein
MNQRDQGDRVLLADPGTGQDVVLARSDITEIAASPMSPMPSTFESTLSEAELFDLIEFLRAPAK